MEALMAADTREKLQAVIKRLCDEAEIPTRYLLLSTLNQWRPAKPKVQKPLPEYSWPSQSGQNWMQ
jgi:hypothetical protein